MKNGFRIFITILIINFFHFGCSNTKKADFVLYNGKIVTVDADFSICQSVAVRKNKIIFTGTNQEAEQFISKKTKVIQLDGKLVLPRDDINRYAFVLRPLAEIAGTARHPVTGICYADMWAAFDDETQPLTRIDWPPAASAAEE